ncbi:Ras-like protein gene family, member A [Nematocida sp. AWRm77]|nr:Ras-like protein gene family, member A [Nematocida sp. AWRm77]
MKDKTNTCRAKVVVVGDGACGKTCFLEVYRSDVFPEDYVPTIVDNFVKAEKVGEKEVNLTLWDTSGQDEYDALRPLSYREADLVLICYSIEKKEMLSNIENKWVLEVQSMCKNTPYFLVGLKADIRDEAPSEQAENFVSKKEGEDLAKKIGAKYFGECSAKKKQNIEELFQEISKYVLEHEKKSSSKSGFRWLWCC